VAAEPIPFREPTERPDAFELVDCDFGPDTNKAIADWLQEALTAQVEAHRNLHTAKIPKWERLYNGDPLSETKSFPFPNCSNIVVQLIGDRVDTITARVLGYIFATNPLWHFMYPALTDDTKTSEKERETLEQFMDTMGYEPGQLDLYRIYGQWFTDGAKLGTSFVGLNWKDSVEAVSTGYSENKKAKFKKTTIYEGPSVEKLAHSDITMDAAAHTIEDSRLVTKKVRLKKYDLEERVFEGFYDKAAVEAIIDKPDRQGPELNDAKKQRKQGVTPIQGTVNAEWDIYECYFPWIHQKKKFRLIYSYHLSTKTVMRKIFNFVPKNATPIVRTKLGYRNDGAYGRGFSQMLDKYQQEATDVHNNRIDNSTLANTRFWRLAPSAVNIGSQIEIFPSSAITANKDEVEAFAMADVYQSSFQNEESVMALADARAGIAPAVSGAGAGGAGKGKGNPYTAAGTMVATQEGNHRTNLMTSDFRHAHQNLGSKLADMYAKFGTSGKEKMFGKDAHYLTKALKEYAENLCLIPIRSTSASINKEVEKQNDMLMVGLVQRHYTAQAQLMQAITNPMIPPEAKAYLTKVLGGADRLMYRILRDFGYDQPNDFVPDATETSQQSQQPQGAPNAPQGPAVNPAALASARSAVGGAAVPSGPDQGNAQVPGMGGPQGGPGGVAQ
jgi:hypothetical protein